MQGEINMVEYFVLASLFVQLGIIAYIGKQYVLGQ